MSDQRAGRIEFEGVWKKFRYGEIHTRLRDLIPALAARAVRRNPARADLWSGEFWALQDISFQVEPGEALGIIGPNGAGKSTILKLLTKIMRPTRGRCAVAGRIGALIEVSAGFHPDLTGRENIFLQGAIMGMPRREIARKFDQIVEFSEIPWFIDTPVKRYSSGMQARLGFAVAAHLDPEVLIIDEALAVGDAAFQRKAFQRVTELVRSDIPVVVVSHQLDAIVELCTHALLLQKGRVVRDGTPRECIAQYLDGIAEVRPAAAGESAVRIDALKTAEDFACSGAPLEINLECSVRAGGWTDAEAVSLRVRSPHTGEILFSTSTLRLSAKLPETGQFQLAFELQFNVPAGVYLIESFVWDRIMERESFAGPCTHLEVRGGADFEGPVQMNPRVNVRSSTRVDSA